MRACESLKVVLIIDIIQFFLYVRHARLAGAVIMFLTCPVAHPFFHLLPNVCTIGLLTIKDFFDD